MAPFLFVVILLSVLYVRVEAVQGSVAGKQYAPKPSRTAASRSTTTNTAEKTELLHKSGLDLSPWTAADRRRACGVYLWDAPGALLHAWCTRLMRDCVYEGRGGKKFVRVEPGSVLQLLYPCSRFSPDRCLVCGGTFRDHLTLWWSKHLYTPLDRMLDDTYAGGVRVVDTDSDSPSSAAAAADAQAHSPRKGQGRRHPRPSRRARRDATRYMSRPPSKSTEYAFHRRYVVEVPGTVARGARSRTVRLLVPRSLVNDDEGVDSPTDRRRGSTSESATKPRRQQRKTGSTPAAPSSSSSSSASILKLRDNYVVPMPRPPSGDLRNTSAFLLLARAFTVIALDDLLELEAKDEARAAQEQQMR